MTGKTLNPIIFLLVLAYPVLLTVAIFFAPNFDPRWGSSISTSRDGSRLLIGAVFNDSMILEPVSRLPKMISVDLQSGNYELIDSDAHQFSPQTINRLDWTGWGTSHLIKIPTHYRPIDSHEQDVGTSATDGSIANFDGLIEYSDSGLIVRDTSHDERAEQDKPNVLQVPFPMDETIQGSVSSSYSPYFIVVTKSNEGDQACNLFQWAPSEIRLIRSIPLEMGIGPLTKFWIMPEDELFSVASEEGVYTFSLTNGGPLSSFNSSFGTLTEAYIESGLVQFRRLDGGVPTTSIFELATGKLLLQRNNLNKIHELSGNDKIRLILLEFQQPNNGPKSELVALDHANLETVWTRESGIIDQLDHEHIALNDDDRVTVLNMNDGSVKFTIPLPSASTQFKNAFAIICVAWITIWLLASRRPQWPTIVNVGVVFVAINLPICFIRIFLEYNCIFYGLLQDSSLYFLITALSIEFALQSNWLSKARCLILVMIASYIDHRTEAITYSVKLIVICQLFAWAAILKKHSTSYHNRIDAWFESATPRLWDLLLIVWVFVVFTINIYFDHWKVRGLYDPFGDVFSLGILFLILANYRDKAQLAIGMLALIFLIMDMVPWVVNDIQRRRDFNWTVLPLLAMWPVFAWAIGSRLGGNQLPLSCKKPKVL